MEVTQFTLTRVPFHLGVTPRQADRCRWNEILRSYAVQPIVMNVDNTSMRLGQ